MQSNGRHIVVTGTRNRTGIHVVSVGNSNRRLSAASAQSLKGRLEILIAGPVVERDYSVRVHRGSEVHRLGSAQRFGCPANGDGVSSGRTDKDPFVLLRCSEREIFAQRDA